MVLYKSFLQVKIASTPLKKKKRRPVQLAVKSHKCFFSRKPYTADTEMLFAPHPFHHTEYLKRKKEVYSKVEG